MGVVHSQAPDELFCTQSLVFHVLKEQFPIYFCHCTAQLLPSACCHCCHTVSQNSLSGRLWKEVALCMPVTPTDPTWLLAYPQ